MESLKNLETMVASWYKQVPHLPKNGQKWLAENAWWLTLIGVILGGLGILSALMATMVAGTILVGVGGAVGAAIGGFAFLAVLASLALGAVEIVIAAVAVMPLKAMNKKGWSLLFLAALVNVLSILVTFLFYLNVFSLLWSVLMVAVGGYFLFEVRDYYRTEKEAKKVKA
ncbi:MAG TPA: hypothetical protein VIQ80_03085 [Candidatus Saccharimonadales bacterium]